ncbi:MAG TPA: cupredoxin domain-containing protein [Dehalococcoidia bacterium]
MRALRAVAALGLLAAVLAACGGDGGGGEPVPTDRVEMARSYRFSPETIQVTAGTTVTWTNRDNFTHTVRLLDGSGTDLRVEPGESTSITFERPGTYRYDCSLHPRDMQGTVVVTEG